MLPDLLAPGLDVIFCGTAPGRMSAARGHYYANPGNRFWALLEVHAITPRRLSPAEDHLMPGLGLGLTDLAEKGVAGQDAEIPPGAWRPERLHAHLERLRPGAVAFTSLTAARLALRRRVAAGRGDALAGPLFDVAVFVLPSPSGLARRHFRDAPWAELGAWLAARREDRR